jgi:hypothetical protein
MTPPTDDLSPEIHATMDHEVQKYHLSFHPQAAVILYLIIHLCQEFYAKTEWPTRMKPHSVDACEELLASNAEIKSLLESSHRIGQYSEIHRRCKWHLMPILPVVFTHSSPAELHQKKEVCSIFDAGTDQAS